MIIRVFNKQHGDNTFQKCPNQKKQTYFMLPRHVIDHPNISAKSKGYYAMYVSECIEWGDIPKTNRKELLSIPDWEEV